RFRYIPKKHMSAVTVSNLIGGSLAQEFEDLFREHYQLVYRTAYGITGRAEDAEDVLQMVFLKLMRRGIAPDFRRNPKGYLYRTAVNVSLDAVAARRRHVLTDEADRFETPLNTNHAELHGVTHKQLSDALAHLRPRAVEILIL